MIIWVNGAFGAGKTTLADRLREKLPGALFFDPENIGHVLRLSVPGPDTGDFQDIPLWRELVADTALGLRRHYDRPLVVAMTLADAGYRAEVFGRIAAAGEPLLHVFLEVPEAELRRRIEADQDEVSARSFRLRNVERCVAARDGLPPSTLVLPADHLGPGELADAVLAEVRRRSAPAVAGAGS